MATALKSLQIRVPTQLREEADLVLASIGLDMPTAVRLFLTKVVHTRSIPFPLEAGQEIVESIAVDQETQQRMDGIAASWSARKKKT